MSFKKFIIALIIISILFVIGPVVAAEIARGGLSWIGTFFSNLHK